MKFRSRMIIAYSAVALIASLALGVILSQTGLQYETKSQRNNLLISADSYVTQMDENLDRMNAIMQYILADPSILDGITMLSNAKILDENSLYTRNAENAIRLGLSTIYIMKNSYRTVFFNENNYYSSSVRIVIRNGEKIPVQKLRTGYAMEDVPYLDLADEANGKIVIVPQHEDYWQVDHPESVFSLVKKIRGEGMGYLEVENRMSLLTQLESADQNIQYVILLDSGEVLYASAEDFEDHREAILKKIQKVESRTVLNQNGSMFTIVPSNHYGFSIAVYKQETALAMEKTRVFAMAFLAALVVFGVSLCSIFYMSGLLTKPIRKLQQVVENTNIENLKEKQDIKGTGGPDEFQELMESYQKMTTRLDTALKNEKRSSFLQLQAQFDMLQTQVNPHFIYNVLNIISSRAVIADDEVICEMCGSLGNMLRYSTNNKERYASLRKELDHLDNYFYLLKERYENRLEVTMKIDPEMESVIIPKMTLQQLVENSIKHGFHDTDIHMHIEIIAEQQEKQWRVTVQDNGTGIEEERLQEVLQKLENVRREMLDRREVPTEAEIGGLGLVNTFARCLLLYQENLIFEMKNREDQDGFCITLGSKKGI